MTGSYNTLASASRTVAGLRRRAALQGAFAVLCGIVILPTRADPDDDGFRIGGKPGRGWRMIGEKTARRSLDRDEMLVRTNRAYSAIRLRVFRAPVEILSLHIHFLNGGSREIDVRQFIERGGATRIIDLPGEKRFIERIVFWYKTPALARERATVQVWARA